MTWAKIKTIEELGNLDHLDIYLWRYSIEKKLNELINLMNILFSENTDNEKELNK